MLCSVSTLVSLQTHLLYIFVFAASLRHSPALPVRAYAALHPWVDASLFSPVIRPTRPIAFIYTYSCSQLHSHTLHVLIYIYIAFRQPSFGAPVPGRSVHASSLRVLRRACGSTVWLRSVVHPFAFVRILYILYIYVCTSSYCFHLLHV